MGRTISFEELEDGVLAEEGSGSKINVIEMRIGETGTVYAKLEGDGVIIRESFNFRDFIEFFLSVNNISLEVLK